MEVNTCASASLSGAGCRGETGVNGDGWTINRDAELRLLLLSALA